jgi:hypothetical protein
MALPSVVSDVQELKRQAGRLRRETLLRSPREISGLSSFAPDPHAIAAPAVAAWENNQLAAFDARAVVKIHQ